MGYHIFLTGEDNYEICIRKGVYGGIQLTGSTKSNQINSEIIASLSSIKTGDFVFFYVKNKGIYGLWKTTTGPFFDPTPIWTNSNQTYPYRVCFEPVVRKFNRPIVMNDILDLKDKGKIWTFDLGSITKKSHYPITTDEGKELIRLLLRNNPVFEQPNPVPEPYRPPAVGNLPINFDRNANGHLKYEGSLNAWFMRSFTNGELKNLVGEYQDFLNFVPTSFNKVMDIFLTHATSIDNVNIIHKYTCIELKTGMITEENLGQIIRYENWLVRRLADGDSEMIQSLLVGFDFAEGVVEYCAKRKSIDEKTVRLIKYKLNAQGDNLILEEIK